MNEEDAALRDLLTRTRSIAVVGVKPGDLEDSWRVARYLQRAGYRIRPVNPKLDHVLGERCVASLTQLEEPVDLVNLFRAPSHVPGHADEILSQRPLPLGVWMQLGVRHAEAAARLEAAGIRVVQDRCLMVEHRRLLAPTP